MKPENKRITSWDWHQVKRLISGRVWLSMEGLAARIGLADEGPFVGPIQGSKRKDRAPQLKQKRTERTVCAYFLGGDGSTREL